MAWRRRTNGMHQRDARGMPVRDKDGRWVYPRGYSLEGSLVESVRTPDGPRQRPVAHIGRIHEGWLDGDDALQVHYRSRFWRRLDERLDRLANRLSAEERAAVERAVAARVPRPDPMAPEWWGHAEALGESIRDGLRSRA